MVISASAIPAEMPARPPEAPGAAMPVKAFTIPIVVPSSPTNGAVEPTVAMMPRPRLNSASVMQHLPLDRPLGRVDVGRGDGGPVGSSGFTSESASPRTRATWLFLFFSASVMACSRFSSWMARENWGANFRVAVWLFE